MSPQWIKADAAVVALVPNGLNQIVPHDRRIAKVTATTCVDDTGERWRFNTLDSEGLLVNRSPHAFGPSRKLAPLDHPHVMSARRASTIRRAEQRVVNELRTAHEANRHHVQWIAAQLRQHIQDLSALVDKWEKVRDVEA